MAADDRRRPNLFKALESAHEQHVLDLKRRAIDELVARPLEQRFEGEVFRLIARHSDAGSAIEAGREFAEIQSSCVASLVYFLISDWFDAVRWKTELQRHIPSQFARASILHAKGHSCGLCRSIASGQLLESTLSDFAGIGMIVGLTGRSVVELSGSSVPLHKAVVSRMLLIAHGHRWGCLRSLAIEEKTRPGAAESIREVKKDVLNGLAAGPDDWKSLGDLDMRFLEDIG